MVTKLLLHPLLLLPFCSLWAASEEALFEASLCNLCYFVFAVWRAGRWLSDAGWVV